MTKLQHVLLALCAVAALGTASATQCPSLLALVEQLPSASLMHDLLVALGATGARLRRARHRYPLAAPPPCGCSSDSSSPRSFPSHHINANLHA